MCVGGIAGGGTQEGKWNHCTYKTASWKIIKNNFKRERERKKNKNQLQVSHGSNGLTAQDLKSAWAHTMACHVLLVDLEQVANLS